ncbi:PD-(D/E)XK nuclease family protein, partial [candidate division KSB1 bacterium]|nr:PD-(D/E)XK nuclease family protein [candidate division KSB1 bacterium]
LMAKEGKLDFGDQVSGVLKLLRERPSVLKKIQERYRFILVDEFQDTNYAQFQLVRLLGGEAANITVVGDDDQSIYKFRGAAISNILGFMEYYPSAKQVVLTDNYRSTQRILDASYRLVTHNNPDRLEVRNKIDKKLHAREEGEHPVEHLHCDSLTTESDQVATLIQDLVQNKGYRYQDCAILVRSNNDADPFLRAMNMKDIPWHFSGNRGLYSRPEVKVLISFLRVVANPDDSMALYHLAASDIYDLRSIEDLHRCVAFSRSQNRSLYEVFTSLDTIEKLSNLSGETKITLNKIMQDVHKTMEESRSHITGNILYQFLMDSNYLKRLTQHESRENSRKIQNVARFFDVIWSFAQVAQDDKVIHFVHYLDLLIEAGDDPGAAETDPDLDAVQVMTIHKAKGLEWPAVFMVSLLHNKFPHTRRKDPIELPSDLMNEILPEGDFHLQEERRLFYVGMTRAKEWLFLTSGVDYGGVRKRKVSAFVLEALDRPQIDEVAVKSSAEEKIHRFAPVDPTQNNESLPLDDETILNLSHYQVDDYLTCPLKYKYAHVLRLPFFHHTLVYGKAVHAAVETYYRHVINHIPVQYEDLKKSYTDAWHNIGFLSREHEERRFSAGLEALTNFFQHEEQAGIVPCSVEEKFRFMLNHIRMAGRWDRIDDRNGQIVIVDFKTSEVYLQDAADKRTKDSLQLAIYSLAYEQTHGQLPDSLELHFLQTGLIGSATPTAKSLQKFTDKIEKAATGIRHRDYSANPGYQTCKYCAYSTICPSAAKV